MDIFVLVRGGVDTGESITVTDGEVNLENVMFITNPFDEFAIEAGLQLKEKFGGSVTAISMGDKHAEQALRNAIAMGVDHGILIKRSDYFWLGAMGIARHLADVLSERRFDLILAGNISTDMQRGGVTAYLSAMLGIPFVPSITGLSVDDGIAVVEREEDWGKSSYKVTLPALLSCDKGLNQPRLPSFRGVMKAKRAKLEVIEPAELHSGEAEIAGVEKYARSRQRQIFEDFEPFFEALKKGGVL